MKYITLSGAIAQGYTHCGNKYGEYITSLKNIDEVDLESSPNDHDGAALFVCKKEHASPTISEDSIVEIISESIYGDEEFTDESDMIGEKVAEVIGRLKVSEAINEALSDLKYYMVSDIQLVSKMPKIVIVPGAKLPTLTTFLIPGIQVQIPEAIFVRGDRIILTNQVTMSWGAPISEEMIGRECEVRVSRGDRSKMTGEYYRHYKMRLINEDGSIGEWVRTFETGLLPKI